ncbi:hypothetical protein ACFSKN_04705 [Mariniflexile gromovii]|uniref:Major tail protein n=1 Tax=Mariniflexile gromovii TaxID=362523 RepID=A0ABS4BWA5_9FLAO|nr:hypothetical protein [Mariniflexile gromovii]MBP0904852.1 hypothetical protein [Mariniflexile gromovii]
MACNNKLTDDILQSCDDLPRKGLKGSSAVIINYDDIDFTSTTSSGATVSSLTLQSGKTGYKLEWFKELGNAGAVYAPNSEDIDGFTASFASRLTTNSTENSERANEIKNGLFVMVVRTKYVGNDGLDEFKIYGFENGLRLSEMTHNTNENSAGFAFTLSTEEGAVEQYPYYTFLETDYATSKASYDALFAEA